MPEGQGCTICSLPAEVLVQVNQKLRSGIGQTPVARDYGLSRDAVGRHWRAGHHKELQPVEIPEIQKPSIESKKTEIAPVQHVDVLQAIATATRHIESILGEYKKLGNTKGALEAGRVLKPFLELQAKIEGLIKEGQVNILVNPQWTSTKAAIMRALERYPDARQAVLDELSGMRTVEGEYEDAEG